MTEPPFILFASVQLLVDFRTAKCEGTNSPVDTGRKLNVYKTFRRRPGRLLNVLCAFSLRPVSAGRKRPIEKFVFKLIYKGNIFHAFMNSSN